MAHFRHAYFDPSRLAPLAGGVYPTLTEAVKAYFESQPDLITSTSDGKLWEDEAPEGTKLPYVTFFLPSEATEEWTTRAAIGKVRSELQFNVHHWTSKQAKSIAATFRTRFKMAPLNVAGVPILHCLPTGRGHAVGERLGDRGRDCHIEVLTFDVLHTQS